MISPIVYVIPPFKFFVCLHTRVYCGIFRPNMLKCFIPLGVNASNAYWVFHVELIKICFTSFVKPMSHRTKIKQLVRSSLEKSQPLFGRKFYTIILQLNRYIDRKRLSFNFSSVGPRLSDISVDGQLHLRVLSFFVNNLKIDNTCVKLCSLLCLRGSHSRASYSLNFITNRYSLDKFNIVDISFVDRIIDVNSPI